MSTKIEQMQDRLLDVEARAHYSASLIAALGDPSKYEYTGICVDAGKPIAKCACGHPIRYCYHIQHTETKKTEIVGSTCIDHFEHVNPALYAALIAASQKLQEQIAEAKKTSKAAQAAEEIAALNTAWQSKLEDAKAYVKSQERTERRNGRYGQYEVHGRLPYELWYTWSRTPRQVPEYTRPVDFKRWYNKQIQQLDRMMTTQPTA